MANFISSFARAMLPTVFSGLLVVANGWVSASEIDNNQRDIAAMKTARGVSSQSMGQGYFASTVVHPAGTKFVFSDIHVNSAWYSDSTKLVGKQATAVDCVSGITHDIEQEAGEKSDWHSGDITHGIEQETGERSGRYSDDITHGIELETGEKSGWYSGCFKLDGDNIEYFISGFKFVLPTPTTVVPSTGATGDCVADYSATGELHVPCVRVPGAFGRIETYDVWLKQRAGSFTFDLDTNRIQSK